MVKPRMNWNHNMELIVLDLWSENFDEFIEQHSKKKEEIYKQMTVAFNQKYPMKMITKFDLRIKINNLTQKYRQEKKLLIASGIGTSTWPYFEKIHQLFTTREQKLNTTNTDLFDTTNLSEIKSYDEDDLQFEIFENKFSVDEYKQMPTDTLSEHKKKLPFSAEKLMTLSPKTILYEEQNMLKKENLNGVENGNNEKPYDQFGKYVAAELRQLPIREGILLQQELQNSIIRFKLSCLEHLSSNNFHCKVQNRSPSSSS